MRIAMQQKVPIVPVYVFGQSVLWSQVPLPRWVDAQPKCGESGGAGGQRLGKADSLSKLVGKARPVFLLFGKFRAKI